MRGDREIFSLGALMTDLGVEFTKCPKDIPAIGVHEFGCDQPSCPKKEDIIRTAIVTSRDKEDPLWDEGKIYHVTRVPPEILRPNQTIMQFIADIFHATACGCGGCHHRIQVYYDKKKPQMGKAS